MCNKYYAKVLVVNNENNFASYANDLKKMNFYTIMGSYSMNDLIELIKREKIDILIVGFELYDMSIVDFIGVLNKLSIKLKGILIISSYKKALMNEYSNKLENYRVLLPDCLVEEIRKKLEELLSYNKNLYYNNNFILSEPRLLVTNIMIQLRIPANLKGYDYLREAILLCTQNTNYIRNIMSELYPAVAKKFDSTPMRVERSIRHAIELAWYDGNLNNSINILGCVIDMTNGKPSNSQLIAQISDILRLYYNSNNDYNQAAL